jgi:uncharacterized RDD family membrane protein YckC
MSAGRYIARATQRMTELDGTPLAPFGRRLAAFVIDLLVIGTVTFLVAAALAKGAERANLVSADQHISIEINFKNWYSLAIFVLYFGLATYFTNGLTLGKRLARIRVVSTVHHSMTFWHSIERALGYGASALEFGLGFVQYFMAENRQTTHDRIAGTIAVAEPRRAKHHAGPATQRAGNSA